MKSLAVLSAWQQRKYFDTSAEPGHKHTVLGEPWKWWSLFSIYEYTQTQTQTQAHEWKADILLTDVKSFFSFHFWKDEAQKLDNQGDDEVDMQMHGVSLGQ